MAKNCLQLTTVDDRGLDGGADSTRAAAEGLELLDDLHGRLVSNLAEDDVLAIEPRGDNGGDEELGAVAVDLEVSGSCSLCFNKRTYVWGPALAMERRPGRLCL